MGWAANTLAPFSLHAIADCCSRPIETRLALVPDMNTVYLRYWKGAQIHGVAAHVALCTASSLRTLFSDRILASKESNLDALQPTTYLSASRNFSVSNVVKISLCCEPLWKFWSFRSRKSPRQYEEADVPALTLWQLWSLRYDFIGRGTKRGSGSFCCPSFSR